MKDGKHAIDVDSYSVKRICEGDMSEFRNIVEKYKDVSFSLACSILKDEKDAEDVLQDAFMKVLKNIGKFRFDSAFSTWLYRVVVTTCLNAKDKNKKYRYDKNFLMEEKQATERSGLDTYREKERSNYIAAALKMMKVDESLLLRLYYLCDLSITEISDVTDFSESNIKVILHRGRKNIHEILKKLTGNELNDLI